MPELKPHAGQIAQAQQTVNAMKAAIAKAEADENIRLAQTKAPVPPSIKTLSDGRIMQADRPGVPSGVDAAVISEVQPDVKPKGRCEVPGCNRLSYGDTIASSRFERWAHVTQAISRTGALDGVVGPSAIPVGYQVPDPTAYVCDVHRAAASLELVERIIQARGGWPELPVATGGPYRDPLTAENRADGIRGLDPARSVIVRQDVAPDGSPAWYVEGDCPRVAGYRKP